MRAICLRLAATGFVASAALHLLSFTPWAPLALTAERAVWALGILVFALTAVMVARLRRTAALGRRWARVAVYDWRALVRARCRAAQGFVPDRGTGPSGAHRRRHDHFEEGSHQARSRHSDALAQPRISRVRAARDSARP